MVYPKSYHLACRHLVQFGAHTGNTQRGRMLIAAALKDVRKQRGSFASHSIRRHMLYISGMFPIK